METHPIPKNLIDNQQFVNCPYKGKKSSQQYSTHHYLLNAQLPYVCGVLLTSYLLISCEKEHKISNSRINSSQKNVLNTSQRGSIDSDHTSNPKADQLDEVIKLENKKYLYQFSRNHAINIQSNDDFAKLFSAVISNLPYGAQNDALESIISNWIQKDPTAAIAYIKNLAPGKNRQLALGLWLTKSSLTDAVTVANNKDYLYPEEHKSAIESVYWNAVQKTPEELIKYLRLHSPPCESKDKIYRALGSVSAKQGLSLSSTLSTTSNDDGQILVIRGWMAEMAISAPLIAKKEIQKNTNLSEYIPMIVSSCYSQDKAETIEWVESIQDENQKSAAVNSLVDVWYEENSEDASKWVAAQPQSKIKDKGSLAIVRHLVKTGDNTTAMEWANSISDENIKASAIATIRINNP